MGLESVMIGTKPRWMVVAGVISGALSMRAVADQGILGLSNPLNLYLGGGVGRSSISQPLYDSYEAFFSDTHVSGHPLGWNAVIGIRPVSFLGAEAEYLDYGTVRNNAGPLRGTQGDSGSPLTSQFLGSKSHDQSAAAFAVGYVPLPLPFIEPFAKLGAAWVHRHDSYSGDYEDEFINGVPVGAVSGSNGVTKYGIAYGGGVQLRIDHLAVRVEYVRTSLTKEAGSLITPSLLSIGANWTF
jgi:Outer membrane protein beta-barrel domain